MGAVTQNVGSTVNSIFPGLGGTVKGLLSGPTLNGAEPPPPPLPPAATPPRANQPTGINAPRPIFGSMGGTIITGPQGVTDPVSVSNKQLLGG